MKLQKLDELDSRIIKILKRDASVSVGSIARELNVPEPTAYFRINRLKKRGVLHYTIRVNQPEGEASETRVALVYPRHYAVSGMTKRVLERLGKAIAQEPSITFAAEVDGRFIVAWTGDFDPHNLPDAARVETTSVKLVKA